MTDDRKKLLNPWIVGVLIGLPVLYVASFGPACWVTSRTGAGAALLPSAYRPVTWIWERSPTPVAGLFKSYAKFGSRDGWDWYYVDDEAFSRGWYWLEEPHWIPVKGLLLYGGRIPALADVSENSG